MSLAAQTDGIVDCICFGSIETIVSDVRDDLRYWSGFELIRMNRFFSSNERVNLSCPLKVGVRLVCYL